MKDVWTVLGGLFLTFLIIYLAYRFSKMLLKQSGSRFKNRYLKEIDRVIMGQEAYISLVRVGSEVHLIGVTKQNINYMAQISEESLVEIEKEAKSADPAISPVYSEFFNKLKEKSVGGQKLWFKNRTGAEEQAVSKERPGSSPDREKDLEND